MPPYKLFLGDCVEVMKKAGEGSIDSLITDPPYGLSLHKPEDIQNALTAWLKGEPFLHKKRGFMNSTWDGFVPGPEVWKECYRVLKPGGYMLVFSSTRTMDLMGIAIRLAGFRSVDSIHWTFGSGFPKSHNLSIAIDKMAGAEREVIGVKSYPREGTTPVTRKASKIYSDPEHQYVNQDSNVITAPATPEVKQWEGWGTALKPSHEIILLCQKPISEKTIAKNVLKHGTGGLHIDACRVSTQGESVLCHKAKSTGFNIDAQSPYEEGDGRAYKKEGRWPPNSVLTHSPLCRKVGKKKVKGYQINRFTDGMKPFGNGAGHPYEEDKKPDEELDVYECVNGCPVKELSEQSGERPGCTSPSKAKVGSKYRPNQGDCMPQGPIYPDKGTAARYFPCFEQEWECVEGCPVKELDEQSGDIAPPWGKGKSASVTKSNLHASQARPIDNAMYRDPGGASKYFPCFKYQAKAAKKERNLGCEDLPKGNNHATVKPLELMRWLVKLVTPPGGVVLDPFTGSGTTGMACLIEEFKFVGIEKEKEYYAIAQARIEHINNLEVPYELAKRSIKAKKRKGKKNTGD